jgi:hypothetical protein
MMQTVACAVAFVLFAGVGSADDKANKQARQKNQMVRGTIKSVDVSKNLLIVNQKVKNEFVERQLDVQSTTEFIVTGPGGKKEGKGADGLQLLEGKEGATIAVKCDKDVKPTRVTVMIKK